MLPNADSYRDVDLKQIYKQHENDKKRYAKSNGRVTGNIYTISPHNNRRHERRVQEIR